MIARRDRVHAWHVGDRITARRLNEGGRVVNIALQDFQGLLDRITSLERVNERQARPWFMSKLGAATSLGGNQWTYPIEEVANVDGGYGSWIVVPTAQGGISGTARNLLENGNDGSGTEDMGVDVDNLQGTFAVQALVQGAIVPTFPNTLDDSTMEYWLWPVPNGVDGVCA